MNSLLKSIEDRIKIKIGSESREVIKEVMIETIISTQKYDIYNIYIYSNVLCNLKSR